MTAAELKAIMSYLEQRVVLAPRSDPGTVIIDFAVPGEQEMVAAGLDAEGARRILSSSWWDEMVADIVETPEMCDPGDPPARILQFARDVVSEYIRKRYASD